MVRSDNKQTNEQEVDVHTHPTTLAMIIKARQAELLHDARGNRYADPYRVPRPTLIRRWFNRIVISVANMLIAIGMQLKRSRVINETHLVDAHASCRIGISS